MNVNEASFQNKPRHTNEAVVKVCTSREGKSFDQTLHLSDKNTDFGPREDKIVITG